VAASEEVTEVVSAAVSEVEVSERSCSSKIDYNTGYNLYDR
jgi:hypothetical protein